MRASIRHLEELSLNAWPAHHTIVEDGWILRLANGYTRRANSVNPLYPHYRDIRAKLESCEAFYRRHGQEVVLKLTPAVYPEELDKILDAEGYRRDALTAVKVLALDAPATAPERVAITADALTPEWLGHFVRLSSTAPRHVESLAQILGAIVPLKCLAILREGDSVVSCGLGVLENNHLGIFDLVTDPACRRRGHARQMMLNLLDWGRRNGAQTAYLQVMLNNPPALQLYAGLGFRELYQYWYRIKG